MARSGEELDVEKPTSVTYVVRETHSISVAQRERVLKATEYNCFAFPSGMLTVDYLSDSGSTSMTDVQWAVLMRGDEAYGRNHGYYALLEQVRRTFDEEDFDDPVPLVAKLLPDIENMTWHVSEKQLKSPSSGGFANGGIHQLTRPNLFIVPQGRCAEFLLFHTLQVVLKMKNEAEGKTTKYVIPSNGFFDTTEAQAAFHGFEILNLFSPRFFDEFDAKDITVKNPFKGDIDVERLKELLEKEADRVPLILLTITNNTAGGQPVSMKNIIEVSELGKKYDIPVFFDAARFAENMFFVKEFEEGYSDMSVKQIVKKAFSYVDGFTVSLKKDGLSNIGGLLAFRDGGVFQRKYSIGGTNVGTRIKELQILNYGNDSYGGLSGRDIMAVATGLWKVLNESYLRRRIMQVRKFAVDLIKADIPGVLLPPGGHALYLNMSDFFKGTKMEIGDFGGVGLVIELIRLYGIRACELGPFAFEWDQKTEEQRKGILNNVRFAVPRNLYHDEHITYTVEAIKELYRHRESIPRVIVSRGKELHLRHFQSGLSPIYENEDKE